ncbi:lactonase family protein [Heyndrickxia acidicola]|uniref:Lactonase family protein n=1 Tax=Heyndrickxia acidicola TaxID=209389 RepID=A0ABU6MID6_9BACI|nr:lactonase family protein [Heyndrickxia acidicola]MED1204447.1 lactonase family protein [Heyndrickxia acidicola]
MATGKTFRGFIGTYTKGDSKGIYTFTFNTETKKLEDVKAVAELGNPTYLTISPDNQYLYAVEKDGGSGGVSSYSVNSETGELEFLSKQLLEGASPCHISVKHDNSTIVTANYHKGTIESYLVKDNGKVEPRLSVDEHQGSGPNKDRQEKPHAHYSGFTPDEKYVAAIDLGIDAIDTYEVKEGVLKHAHRLTVKAGSGPRHLEFHPNGKFAYVMTELSSEVIALQYNEEDGSFKEVQYISTIPADFTENNQGSAIHVSADGKFVYAANRGHNSIAVFRIHEGNGELELVEITSTEGNWPRDFEFDPTEQFLVASNEESGNLVLYSRNTESGKLSVLQSDAVVPYPVCVKFLNY